ncbi:MAG: ribonuclease PH [Candidatus Hydrogenedentes bacterium]|nr:ribonuclease PH [Candidatus Hydrogenedentota bacterium]
MTSSKLRTDHRNAGALRPVTFERNFTKYAAGSVLVSFGDTRVLCTATLEPGVPPWMRDSGRGWITAEYAMLPGSSSERIQRNHSTKGRALEISRLIGRSLRAVVDLEQLGERQITLDCDVLQADGGTRTAAITGGYVALCDAINALVQQDLLKVSPIIAPCAAVSVGIVDGVPMVDLCYTEDSAAEVDMNVVMNGKREFLEIQGCAEGKPFSRSAMDTLLDLAEMSIAELIALQEEALRG